jgi:polyhydroxybutyrate depolymerase
MVGRRRPALSACLLLLCCPLVLASCGSIARTSAHASPAPPAKHAGASSASSLAATGCGKSPPTPPGSSADRTLQSGGITRIYRVHVPRGYRPSRRTALVLSFHGHGSSAAGQELMTGFSTLADRDGFLVVYPQGTIGPDGMTGWATGPRKDPTVNDVRFVADLLTRLQSSLCVDPARIYATGFSNGGAMTVLLACTMAGRIAAFAPVSGSYYPVPGGCRPSRPVPLLEVHGTADRVVPYDGSPARRLPPIRDWLAQWATRDGCAQQPQVFLRGQGILGERWTGCREGALVEHYRLAGGAHIWPDFPDAPGTDVPGTDQPPDATAIIWAFLAAHPLDQTDTSGRAATARSA